MQLNNTSGHHVSYSIFEWLQNRQIAISNRKFCGVTEHWSTAAGPLIVQSLVISSDPYQCATDRWVMMSAEGGVGGLFTALCVCVWGGAAVHLCSLSLAVLLLPGAQLRLAAATDTDNFLETSSVLSSWSAVSPGLWCLSEPLNFVMSLWRTQRRCTAGLCCILLALCSWISAFNLDTTTILIKEGEEGSFFGFSLALHQQLTPEPHSWWVYQLDYCFGLCRGQKSSLQRMIVTWNMILYCSTVHWCQ